MTPPRAAIERRNKADAAEREEWQGTSEHRLIGGLVSMLLARLAAVILQQHDKHEIHFQGIIQCPSI
jgi:hypothetical protein